MRGLMRGRLLVGFVAVAVLVPSVVLATHTFADVPDGTYYTAAVEWAGDTGVTSGTSATTFSPNAPVTRAQNVTFAYRYDQNVVQPALDAIRQSPERVVWVADDGTGDFLLLSTALASISDASASNPYVVRIAPGEYTETATVALKTYVAVEGSGQGVTTITCACGGADYDASAATVSVGDIVAEIRHLTINNTGGDTRSYGVYTEDVVDGSVSMSDVTATATGASTYNASVVNYDSSPSMTNVTATATGGTTNYGVYNEASSPSMTDVTATATDGTYNYGVYNYDSSSPSMTDVTATATGGTYNYGVYNNSTSSPSMTDVTATATGGTQNYGVFNKESSSPSIRNSSFTGATKSIHNSGTSSAHVADTMFDGLVRVGGGLTCVGAYDETFSALNASCS